MAQQDLIIGAADESAGDTYFDAFTKVQANTTELFGFQTNNTVIINVEADFPTQDANTITLEAGIGYFLGDVIITSKRFICESGSVMRSNTGLNISLICSGSGNLFTMDANVLFQLADIGIACPLANLFAFNGATALDISNTAVFQLQSIGTFVAGTVSSIVIDNFAVLPAGNGFDFTGNWNLLSMMRITDNATSASHKFLDLGTATFDDFNVSRCNPTGPVGSVFIDGATASANINAERLAVVIGCTVSGGMTDLVGVTNTDVRWDFDKNSPTADTVEDALLSFNGSSTETVISTINTPVKVTAAWTCIRESKFTCDTTGRITSNSERDLNGVPIDVNVGLVSSGGGSINVTVYLAKNGTAITASATTVEISGSNQALVSIPWQDAISENDFYEIFIENNSNTTNIIVESGKLRLR